jgi:hypothetical protein
MAKKKEVLTLKSLLNGCVILEERVTQINDWQKEVEGSLSELQRVVAQDRLETHNKIQYGLGENLALIKNLDADVRMMKTIQSSESNKMDIHWKQTVRLTELATSIAAYNDKPWHKRLFSKI